jgi:hypothetical protein
MESLLLFCRALSSPTMCRFIPALSVPKNLPGTRAFRPGVALTGWLRIKAASLVMRSPVRERALDGAWYSRVTRQPWQPPSASPRTSP